MFFFYLFFKSFKVNNYLTSTVAPTSFSLFSISVASSLETPSLSGFGALSTKSLASLVGPLYFGFNYFNLSEPISFNTTSTKSYIALHHCITPVTDC